MLFSLPFAQFIKSGFQAWRPTSQFVDGWHIKVVCEYLEEVSKGNIKRLQVWIPPGTMKTGIISIYWPAWEWTWDPGMRYFTASYETTFAWRITGWWRDVLLSEWYQARWGEKFQLTQESTRYVMNNMGGHCTRFKRYW